MANKNSNQAAADQNRESYADDSQSRRTLLVPHAGKYSASHRFGLVGNNTAVDVLIITDATKVTHLMYDINVKGFCHLDFFEGTTVSANGVVVAAYDKDRTATTVPDTAVHHTPTVTGVGTMIDQTVCPTAVTKTASGKGNASDTEWILATGTNYMLRITNRSGAATDISVSLVFYEE